MSTAAVSVERESVTILLVSPREDDRGSLQAMLGHSNWRLRVAPDCRAALGILQRSRIPVVICACSLPDGTWRNLLEQTNELPRPPRVIVCSRLADHALWGEVLNLGCYDVFQTPFEPEEVFRVVHLAWQSWKREYEKRDGAPRRSPSLSIPTAASG